MSQEFCKHIVDGKEVFYKKDDCPICGTAKPKENQRGDRETKVYAKNQTIVVQSGKALMMTIHGMKDKPVILFNTKWMSKNPDGSLIIGNDNHPMWSQKTIGLPKNSTKTLYDLLGQLINGTLPIEKQQTIPARA